MSSITIRLPEDLKARVAAATARGVLSTEAAINAPCSVKANGIVGENLSRWRWSQFATTSSRSARVSAKSTQGVG